MATITDLHVYGMRTTSSGTYEDGGLKVMAGSLCLPMRKDHPDVGAGIARQRIGLSRQGVLRRREQGDWVFLTDHVFADPSSASSVLLGFETAGESRWQNCEGITLATLLKLAEAAA